MEALIRKITTLLKNQFSVVNKNEEMELKSGGGVQPKEAALHVSVIFGFVERVTVFPFNYFLSHKNQKLRFI